MLKAKLNGYYRSQKTGSPVFVYHVTGTAEEMAAFEAAKGTYFRKDEAGNVLHFSPRALSNNRNESITLTITQNNNIVVDDLNKVLDQNSKLEDYILREQAKVMAAAALSKAGVRGIAELTAPTAGVATPVEVEAEVNDIPA